MLKQLPEACVKVSENVAYSWFTCDGASHECIQDINHLHVWHWRDGRLEVENRGPVSEGWFPCWRASGVGLHDLIQADPLHIEASVYWPECCGLHGFIRDGRWVEA